MRGFYGRTKENQHFPIFQCSVFRKYKKRTEGDLWGGEEACAETAQYLVLLFCVGWLCNTISAMGQSQISRGTGAHSKVAFLRQTNSRCRRCYDEALLRRMREGVQRTVGGRFFSQARIEGLDHAVEI